MRIRKQSRGHASSRMGEASSVLPEPAGLPSREQQQEVDLSSRGVKEKHHRQSEEEEAEETTSSGVMKEERGCERRGSGGVLIGEAEVGISRGGSGSRSSSFTWLDKLRHTKGFTSREPYGNLDEFVSSLARRDSSSGDHIEAQQHVDDVVGGGDSSSLSLRVIEVDLNAAAKLMRDNSVASQMSSKPAAAAGNIIQAPAGEAPSPAMISCHDSSVSTLHGSVTVKTDFRLQSDASLPMRGKNIEVEVENPAEKPSGGAAGCSENVDDPGNSALSFHVKNWKRKQEEPRQFLKSSESSGEDASSSWKLDASDRSDSFSAEAEENELDSKSIVQGHLSGKSSMKQKHEARASRMRGGFSFSLATREINTEPGCTSNLPTADPTDTKLKGVQQDNIQTSPPGMQRRSSRNRRVSSSTGQQQQQQQQQQQPAAIIAASLAQDHPANQPKESLLFSLYTVFSQAGRAGLTTREAVSNILQQALGGLEEGSLESRRQVTKVLRSSPYFIELQEAKFALCSAMVEGEQDADGEDSMRSSEEEEETSDKSKGRAKPGHHHQQQQQDGGSSKSCKRKKSKHRVEQPNVEGQSKRVVNVESEDLKVIENRLKSERKRKRAAGDSPERDTDDHDRPVKSGRPKKLKYMKQENIEELGNQCNRTDGKGWTCPLLAKPGYQLCDHHLDKLRCKPGSRSKKKLAAAAAAAAEAEEEDGLLQAQAHSEPQMVRRKTRTSRSALPMDEDEVVGTADTAGHEFTTTL